MAVKIPADQIQDLQQVEVVVAGPDGANRLFIITGRISIAVFAQSSSSNIVIQKENFLVSMGPALTRRQFVSASGNASLTGMQNSVQSTPASFGWSISTMDADWDDQSGKVELSLEVNVTSIGTSNFSGVNGISFHVMVLAEMA